MASKPEKLIWHAPKWSTTPKRWWVLRKYLLSPGPLVRMTCATLFIVVTILGTLRLAFPGIIFPNVWPIIFALPAVIGLMVLQTGLQSLFRQRMLVTRTKILISHGQSATLIRPETLQRVKLTVHGNGRSRLRFDYAVKSKHRFKTVGLSHRDCITRCSEGLTADVFEFPTSALIGFLAVEVAGLMGGWSGGVVAFRLAKTKRWTTFGFFGVGYLSFLLLNVFLVHDVTVGLVSFELCFAGTTGSFSKRDSHNGYQFLCSFT